jgi:molybdopterin synthase catalytic subunit
VRREQHPRVLICDLPLDLNELNRRVQTNQGESGAAVIFTGAVRISQEEQGLTGMTLEHYPGMTERQLETILAEAEARFQLSRILVAHRVGFLAPGDPIVFVGVCGLHRKEAFEGAQFIMDYLKQKATFWKKEHYGDRAEWVSAKESDKTAAARWVKPQ